MCLTLLKVPSACLSVPTIDFGLPQTNKELLMVFGWWCGGGRGRTGGPQQRAGSDEEFRRINQATGQPTYIYTHSQTPHTYTHTEMEELDEVLRSRDGRAILRYLRHHRVSTATIRYR